MVQRYLTGLPRYLRRTVPLDDCRTRVARQIGARETSFLRLLELGVVARRAGPYARLLAHAGLGLEDVKGLLSTGGMESTLSRLYDEGVYLTHAEVTGRVDVRRGSLRFRIEARDLDNPLSMDAFTVRTGGSRNPGRRMTVDLDMLAAEALHYGVLLQTFGLADSPLAVWRDVPPARQSILRRSGTRGLNRYAMAEVGFIGMPCANPSQPDAVHVMTDKLEVLCRPTTVGDWTVGEVHLTTLHPASPKIFINAATGDHAEIGEWACGCPLRRLGMRTMLRGIGSHEKLTGEGMTFNAGQVAWIVDELLPGRFGGHPTDYQFLEEEDEGLTRLTLAVSARVGPIDEAEVVGAVLEALSRGGAVKDLMAGAWRQGDTLRVVRREPHVTSALKILPLHVARRAGGARVGRV